MTQKLFQMMFRFVLFVNFTVFFCIDRAIGQAVDSVETKEKFHLYDLFDNNRSDFRIVGEYNYISNFLLNDLKTNDQFLIGLEYKKFQLGTYISLFDGDYRFPVIFPNDALLRYVHGGGFFGYRFYDKNRLYLDTRLFFGAGDMIWEDENTFFNYFRDTYWVLHPELIMQVNIFRFIDGKISVGYRQFYDVELERMSNRNFSGITRTFGVVFILSKKK